jgi:hypothetical protein
MSGTGNDLNELFQLLTWVHPGDAQPVDWSRGGLLFAAGFIGAMLTVYLSHPDRLPALGGADETLDLSEELATRRRTQAADLDLRRSLIGSDDDRSRVTDLRGLFPHEQQFLVFLSGQLRLARRSLWLRGIPLFLILGPTAAAVLSTSVWQAITIGLVGPAALSATMARRETVKTRQLATQEMSEVVALRTKESEDAVATLEALHGEYREAMDALRREALSQEVDPGAAGDGPAAGDTPTWSY